MGNESVFNTAKAEETFNLIGEGVLITGTTNGVAATEDAFAHTLGRVPRGILVIEQNKAGTIYLGATGKSATNIYLASDIVSVTFTAYVF